MDAELLESAGRLKWLACPQAGPPPEFYFPELVSSSVIVTNMRGIFNDCISEHIMSFVLAFSRGLHHYLPEQFRGRWILQLEKRKLANLPGAQALIIGVGGIGAATAAHCKHFGMMVTGVDPRVPETPDGVDELVRPERLNDHLPKADFVIMTAPQTPATEGLFDLDRFKLMKRSAIFVNIGRGTSVKLKDLVVALKEGIWGYPFNRSYHMFSAWRILALASTTRARLASFKPGFEPMRTAWTTSNGCGGPTASSVRVAATKAVGAWAMAASCVRRVRHAVR